MEQFKNYVRKIKAYISSVYNELLPEPEEKLAFWVGGAIIFSLIAFVIAALDIGIRNQDCSVTGMIALYIVMQDNSFPAGVWLLCSSLVLALVVYFVKQFGSTEEGRNFKLSESDVYGSSKDISDSELRQVCEIALPEDTDKMILGMAPRSNTKVLGAIDGAMDNPNVAIIGTPGAGKSAGYCIPIMMQIMRRRESVVCSDTKGELYSRTAEIFRANGYVVKKLDLRNPIMSNGWNVLKEMRYDQARAQVFVNTIVSNCKISENYMGFAANLLTAISLYVERNPEIPEQEKNLAKVYQMITTDADNLDTNFKKARNVRELQPAVGAYSSFVRSSDALAGNCINNVASSMGILAADAVQEMLKKDEIDLTLPGKIPCVYYVIMSDQDDTFKFLASLFFAFLFQDLVEFADQQDDQKLPVKCTVLLEEFAQVKIPNIDKKLSTCRSRGIPIIMIMQTLNQLQKEYRDEWETMLDTCAIQICLAANGETTAKYFEKKTGETTAEVKTEQHNRRTFFDSGKYSTGYGKRYYRTADEIRRIPRYHSLIVWQRYNSLITKNFVMDKHPAYPYMERTSSFTSVPLTDLAAREYIRQYEEHRVDVMNDWIAKGGKPMWYCTAPKLSATGPNTGTKPPRFLTYQELEEKALQFSKDNPSVNQKMRQAITDQLYAEARRLQRAELGEPILFTFVDEKPMKFNVRKKKNEERNDPNQMSMEELTSNAHADNDQCEQAKPSDEKLDKEAAAADTSADSNLQPFDIKGSHKNNQESAEQSCKTPSADSAGEPENPAPSAQSDPEPAPVLEKTGAAEAVDKNADNGQMKEAAPKSEKEFINDFLSQYAQNQNSAVRGEKPKNEELPGEKTQGKKDTVANPTQTLPDNRSAGNTADPASAQPETLNTVPEDPAKLQSDGNLPDHDVPAQTAQEQQDDKSSEASAEGNPESNDLNAFSFTKKQNKNPKRISTQRKASIANQRDQIQAEINRKQKNE